MQKRYDYLIVGAGLFGCIFAQQAKEKGKKCLIIDKRDHIGGNIYCQEIEGVNVHKYGAHIFHTDNEHIWEYTNHFIKFNHFINEPLAHYKGELFHLPFNMNTFYQLWGTKTPEEAKKAIENQRSEYQHIEEPTNLEEQALKLCGKDIYYKFIKEYTEKQWGKPATELPPFIIKRIPFRFTYNNNYFNDPYQGIPIGGYNLLIKNLIEGVEVKLNTNFFQNRSFFEEISHKILFTGRIDEFFDFKMGQLEYRSLRFEHKSLDIQDFQGNAVINYNESKYPYTRIIEHKHFEFGNQSGTVITKEYPALFTKENDPYYPVNNKENMLKYDTYKQLADRTPNVLFGGRLGQYAYFDMDDTIESSLKMAAEQLNK